MLKFAKFDKFETCERNLAVRHPEIFIEIFLPRELKKKKKGKENSIYKFHHPEHFITIAFSKIFA